MFLSGMIFIMYEVVPAADDSERDTDVAFPFFFFLLQCTSPPPPPPSPPPPPPLFTLEIYSQATKLSNVLVCGRCLTQILVTRQKATCGR